MTDIIGFENFADEVRTAMELRYPDDRVELKRVTKNNGVIYTGITVCGEDERVYPTMYLEPFYEEAGEEGLTEELIDRMCGIYESRRVGNTLSLEHLKDYGAVKDRLRCRLINYEANAGRLEEIPHRRFLDLAIVPYCMIREYELNRRIAGEASFVVTNVNLKLWGVTGDEVLEDSIGNTLRKEDPQITCMFDMLRKLNPGLAEASEDEIRNCPMYVMTTGSSNGAISMIYEDRLREFCDKIGRDIYIIPSSISEVIIVPYEEGASEEMFNEMIREINETQLERVDILSDHVYYFDRSLGFSEPAVKVKKAS